VNPQLVQYIKENTAAGFSRADMEKALLAAGWSAADVAAAFAPPATPTQPQPAAPAPGPAVQAAAPATAAAGTTPQAAGDFLAQMQQRRAATQTIPATGASTAQPSTANYRPRYQASSPSTTKASGIVGLVLRTGVVKTEAQANMVLIGIIVVAVSLTVWLNWPSSGPSVPPTPLQTPRTTSGAPASVPSTP